VAKRRSSGSRSSRQPSDTRATESTHTRGAGIPPRDGNANLVLASLPDEDYARISARLDSVSLEVKTIIFRPGDVVQHVLFPGGGFCSELAVLQDGTMVEVATTGSEGIGGGSHAANNDVSPSLLMVQGAIPVCYRMPADAFRAEIGRGGALADLATRYSLVLTRVIMQSTACNAVHTVEQRLARWLLRAQDHMATPSFPLTQEFVAMMLGVARPSVAMIAGKLQKAGLIEYHRGHVTIVDREQLEDAACECYATTAELIARL
jgi:hypothetical protein